MNEFVIKSLLYADDADIVTHFVSEMQKMMDRFSAAFTRFGLNINISKTKVIYTAVTGEMYVDPDI